MRVKFFLVLLFCALQEVRGSNSTKNKGEGRLKKCVKNGLIVLAVNYGLNEIDNSANPKLSDSKALVCKYTVPDRNAAVMMNYIACDKELEFEKYLVDNSENCSNVMGLYETVKSVGSCALKNSKAIVNGAIAKFRGEPLNQTTNVEMLKEYLTAYPKVESLQQLQRDGLELKEDFQFFQFMHVLEVTKQGYPADERRAVVMALDSEYKDVDVDHTKSMLELTKQGWPDKQGMAVREALKNEYEDIDVDHAKSMLELTKLEWPNSKSMAVKEALRSEYKDVDVDHAKRLLELTKLMWPDNGKMAVFTVLKYKDVDVDNVKRVLELTKLMYTEEEYQRSRSKLHGTLKEFQGLAVRVALRKYKDVNVDQAKRMLKLTRIMYSESNYWAVKMALETKYKDVNVDKVYEKYQDLKNSWLWYLSSEKDIMEKALKLTHPEVVKEDF